MTAKQNKAYICPIAIGLILILIGLFLPIPGGVYAPDKWENAAVPLLHIRETFRVGCHFIQHRTPADAEARILVLAAEYLGIGARQGPYLCCRRYPRRGL